MLCVRATERFNVCEVRIDPHVSGKLSFEERREMKEKEWNEKGERQIDAAQNRECEWGLRENTLKDECSAAQVKKCTHTLKKKHTHTQVEIK